jgi:hypothetical protein
MKLPKTKQFATNFVDIQQCFLHAITETSMAELPMIGAAMATITLDMLNMRAEKNTAISSRSPIMPSLNVSKMYVTETK